jgi:hypothetical protein
MQKPQAPSRFLEQAKATERKSQEAPKVSAPETIANRPTSSTVSTSKAWILRAVQQDRAWLSPDGEATTLKEVTIGDNIEGLGRILSISQTDGQWIVEGSKARVSQ